MDDSPTHRHLPICSHEWALPGPLRLMSMAKNTAKTDNPSGPSTPPTAHEAKALAVCAAHGNRPDELLEILHALQDELGYVPEATLPVIAIALNLLARRSLWRGDVLPRLPPRRPWAHTSSRFAGQKPARRWARDALCRHAEKKLGTELRRDVDRRQIHLEAVYCLGNCALSPAMMVDEDLYGCVDKALRQHRGRRSSTGAAA